MIFDLVQRTETLLVVGSPISEPVPALAVRVHQLRVGDAHSPICLRLRLSRRRQIAGVETQSAQNGPSNRNPAIAHVSTLAPASCALLRERKFSNYFTRQRHALQSMSFRRVRRRPHMRL